MIVFDLDDTLYLERQFVESGFRAVEAHLHRQGFPALPYANTFLELLDAHGSGQVFNDGLAQLGVDAEVPPLVQIYRTHSPTLSPHPGISRLVAACDRTAIITDGDDGIQRRKLEVLGLTEAFEVILATDTLGADRVGWKPSTKPFEFVEREAGLPGSQLTYIGDNPKKDFVGALERGWRGIRLRLPGQLHESVDTPPPVEEVCSVAALGTLLGLEP